jgi:hypothetical protein
MTDRRRRHTVRMDETPWTRFRDRVRDGEVVLVPVGATDPQLEQEEPTWT